jgi:HYDIN/CFA65/VesB family protein/centrosomal CEP192-like protein
MIRLTKLGFALAIGLILAFASAPSFTTSSASQGSGVITVSPLSQDFGSVVEQVQEVSARIEVLNDGQTNLTVNELRMVGQNPAEFHFLAEWPFTLIPGDRRQIVVSFAPTSTGQKSATLQIRSSATNQAQVDVQLSGNGLSLGSLGRVTASATPDVSNPTPGSLITVDVRVDMREAHPPADLLQSYQASLSYDPAVLDFHGFALGDQPWGSPVSISQTSGNVTWHDVATAAVGGTFSIIRLRFNVIGGAGSSTTLNLGFPRMEGKDVERLLPLLTTSGGTVTVAGQAGPPDISVNPPSFTFGAVAVGGSGFKTFVVSNGGTQNLTVNSTTLGGLNANQFTIESGGGAFTLATGATREIVVGFKPTRTGQKSAFLNISSNDPDERTYSVTLNGNVSAPDIDITPTSLDFGNARVGSVVTKTFAVTNRGTGLLILSMFQLDNPQLQFSFNTPTPVVLGAGASKNIVLNFHPSTVGAKTAVFVISSNDPDEGTVNVPLSGSGVQ